MYKIRTHIYAHAHARTHTHNEAASDEATSVETSYSDNCYYRVTGLIRSIKCKGRRSKSYEYPCTILTVVPHVHHCHMSAHIICSHISTIIFFETIIKIVPHESENFESHEVATSSRQTFRIKLATF